MKCLRCDGEMKFFGTERLQLGKTGWILGDLPNLISGALDVGIYCCDKCGKYEFFQIDSEEVEKAENELPQKTCPKCGKEHDFDYYKCPFCKYEY